MLTLADIEVIEVGFQGPPGTVSPEDRGRIDAAIAAAKALDATAAELLAARDQALAGVRQITGLSAVAGDVTGYDPATGILTVARGETGPAGARGPTGLKGDKGDTGAAGPTGATGPIGPQGPQGAQGVAGPQGGTGATGPKGDKGDTGATGAKGDKGDTGAAGPTGAAGKDGTSWTVTVVTTQSAYDAATPAANQLVVLV